MRRSVEQRAPSRGKRRGTRQLLANRLAQAFVGEESGSKERLRVGNWIVQGLYDDTVKETVEL